MAGRRVKLQALSNTLLTQNYDDYGDLNPLGTLAGTPSTSSVTGTLSALTGTYSTDYPLLNLNFQTLKTTVNSILTSLT